MNEHHLYNILQGILSALPSHCCKLQACMENSLVALNSSNIEKYQKL